MKHAGDQIRAYVREGVYNRQANHIRSKKQNSNISDYPPKSDIHHQIFAPAHADRQSACNADDAGKDRP